MFHYQSILIAILLAILCTPAALAQNQPSQQNERNDRTVYNRLVQQLRQIDSEFTQVQTQALREARDNKGEASLETQSKLISLRDQRDRTLDRITLIALRWGWDIPDLEQPNAANAPATAKSARDEVFEPAKHMIQTQFAAESRRIARSLALPVMSIPQQ